MVTRLRAKVPMPCGRRLWPAVRNWQLLPVISLFLLLSGQLVFSAPAEPGYVGVIDISGLIDGTSARYLTRAVDEATSEGASLLLIKLDTPGGWLVSTREMVEVILGARIPIVVYVSPAGARAGSAGTFITAAANFAVMAPSTNIGAASPVGAGGEDIPRTLAKKINEDTRAFIRSIAEQRGRNIQALEETVTEARSYSASEAVEMNVVDFIAEDVEKLLVRLEGQTTNTSMGAVTVRTLGSNVRDIKQTLLEGFLSILSNPNLAFVLLAIGGLGIWIEMSTPGFIGPGVVGVISLLLAFVAMGNLPVNWVAVGLVLFAMILFYLELLAPGFGIFGIGGGISFVLGGFLLFGDFLRPLDIPEIGFEVSLWVIGVMTLLVGAPVVFFAYGATDSGGSDTGYVPESTKQLVGLLGVAVSDLTPSGKVRLNDEEWTATADVGAFIAEGEEVKVIGVYGDVIRVERNSQMAQRKESS